MAAKPLPSPEALRQLLRYEPETGKLFWRERGPEWFKSDARMRSWNTRYAGAEALAHVGRNGYKGGAILWHQVYAHRVVWAIIAGAWPSDQIDHVNHDKTDNRFGNLREVSNRANGWNQSMGRNNTSGVTGVAFDVRYNKFRARIYANGKEIWLGYHDDIASAENARRDAEAQLGYHPNHGR